MKLFLALLLSFILAPLAQAEITLDVKCVHIGPAQAQVSKDQTVKFNQAILKTEDGKQTVVLSNIQADQVKLGGSYTYTLDAKGPGVPVAFLGGDDQSRKVPQGRGVTKTAEVVEAYAIKLVGTDKAAPWAVNISGLDGDDIKDLSQKTKYFLRQE